MSRKSLLAACIVALLCSAHVLAVSDALQPVHTHNHVIIQAQNALLEEREVEQSETQAIIITSILISIAVSAALGGTGVAIDGNAALLCSLWRQG